MHACHVLRVSGHHALKYRIRFSVECDRSIDEHVSSRREPSTGFVDARVGFRRIEHTLRIRKLHGEALRLERRRHVVGESHRIARIDERDRDAAVCNRRQRHAVGVVERPWWDRRARGESRGGRDQARVGRHIGRPRATCAVARKREPVGEGQRDDNAVLRRGEGFRREQIALQKWLGVGLERPHDRHGLQVDEQHLAIAVRQAAKVVPIALECGVVVACLSKTDDCMIYTIHLDHTQAHRTHAFVLVEKASRGLLTRVSIDDRDGAEVEVVTLGG